MPRIPTAATLRIVYALCMTGAAANHLKDVVLHGLFWDYGGVVPLVLCVFWTSLTFVDTLAVLLLFMRPHAGVALTAAIITADVAVNTWTLFTITLPLNPRLTLLQLWPYFAQLGFLLFVAASARTAWQGRGLQAEA